MNPPLRWFLNLLPAGLVVGACTFGPIGYWGRAPGTNGTLIGLLVYTVLFHQLPILGQAVLLAVFIGLALILCDEGERRLMKVDPGEMILDEVVAVPLCFLGMQSQMAATGHVWAYMLAGFILFRIFDILKPFGISRLQRYPGGMGVVLDDLAAAVATNLTLWLLLLAIDYGGWF